MQHPRIPVPVISPPGQKIPRRPRARRRRFRWFLVLAPLVVLGFMWIAQGIEPSLQWSQLLDLLGVKNRDRYTRLFTLGCVATAFVAILRILKPIFYSAIPELSPEQ